MLDALMVIRQFLSRLQIKKTVKKYTKLWEIINSLIGTEFDSEPVYGDDEKYIKTKIKS